MRGYAMSKISHCGGWQFPVYEQGFKPPKERNTLKRQVLIVYQCRKCKNWLYRWRGIRKDSSRTDLYKITSRQFELEWIPRFQTDIMKPDKVTRRDAYVSEWTKRSRLPADIAAAYINRVLRSQKNG